MGQYHSAPSKPVAKPLESEVQSSYQSSTPSNEVFHENTDAVASSSTARNSEIGGVKPSEARVAASIKHASDHDRTHTEITQEEEEEGEETTFTSHQLSAQPKQQLQATTDSSLERRPSPAATHEPKSTVIPDTTTHTAFPSISSFDKSRFVQANKEADDSSDHVFDTSQVTLHNGVREAEFKFLDEDDLCMMDDILREVS
ncbi:hypothetical protein HDU80_001752 [Chytriomyces hyalinus]|nr:hypothetical protein HDU80_001752 [Chytriomyces hyalinus]